jgi:hypothetical protein
MNRYKNGLLLCLALCVTTDIYGVDVTTENGNYIVTAKHVSVKFVPDKGLVTEVVVDGTKYYTNAGFYVEDVTNKIKYNKNYAPCVIKAESVSSGKDEKTGHVTFTLVSEPGKWKLNVKIAVDDGYGFNVTSELEDTGSTSLRELKTGFVINESKQTPELKLKKAKLFRPDKDRECLVGRKPSTYNFWGFFPPAAPEGTGDTCGVFTPINVWYNKDMCIGLISNPYTQYQVYMFKESMQNLYMSFGLTKGQVAKELNTYVFIKPKSGWRDVIVKYYELYPELLVKGKDYGPMMIVDGFPNDDKWLADVASQGVKTLLFWQYYPEDGWIVPRTEPWEIPRYGGQIKLDWKLVKEFVDKCHSHNLKVVSYQWVGAVFPAYMEAKQFEKALIRNEEGKTIYPRSYLPKVIGFMSLDPKYGYVQDATEQLYQAWLKTGFDGYIFDEVHFAGVDDMVHNPPEGVYTAYKGRPSCSLLYQDVEGWKYMKDYFASKNANVDIILNTWDTIKAPYTVASWQDNFLADFNFRSYAHIRLIFPKMPVGTFGHWDDPKEYEDQTVRMVQFQQYVLWNHFYNTGKSKLDINANGGFLQDYGFVAGPGGHQFKFFQHHKKITVQQYYNDEHQYAEWVFDPDCLQVIGTDVDLCNWDLSEYSVWYNLFSLGNNDYDVRLWNNTPANQAVSLKFDVIKLNMTDKYRYYNVGDEQNKVTVTATDLGKGVSILLEPNETKIVVFEKIK